jgi:hypothetical protein
VGILGIAVRGSMTDLNLSEANTKKPDAFFVFGDEVGEYKEERERGRNFLSKNPFYIRSAYLISISDWKSLAGKERQSRLDRKLPENGEIKWAYLWSLYRHLKNKEEVPQDKPYSFLANYDIETLKEYVSDVVSALNSFDSVKIIFTITMNQKVTTGKESDIIKWHIQDIMQRVEMEIQSSDSLAVFFFDESNEKTNKHIRNCYREIYKTGDFIKQYSHIKDSLAFEISHHSVGLQVADYLCGCLHGALKKFAFSSEVFHKYIKSKLRADASGKFLGFGIREVPRDLAVRKWIDDQLSPP